MLNWRNIQLFLDKMVPRTTRMPIMILSREHRFIHKKLDTPPIQFITVYYMLKLQSPVSLIHLTVWKNVLSLQKLSCMTLMKQIIDSISIHSDPSRGGTL